MYYIRIIGNGNWIWLPYHALQYVLHRPICGRNYWSIMIRLLVPPPFPIVYIQRYYSKVGALMGIPHVACRF